MDIKDFIRIRRDTLGLSLAALAERLTNAGYKAEKQTVSHWEHGRNQPPMESVHFRRALAWALETDVNSMLENIGYVSSQNNLTPEARRAAEIIDHLPDDKRKLAIGLLETLLEA